MERAGLFGVVFLARGGATVWLGVAGVLGHFGNEHDVDVWLGGVKGDRDRITRANARHLRFEGVLVFMVATGGA